MRILFLGTPADKNYLPHLKPYFQGTTTFILTDPIDTLTHLDLYCAKREITAVVSTSPLLLSKLLEHSKSPVGRGGGSLDNYAGSIFRRADRDILFINPLPQLFSVPYGRFITARFISKLLAPRRWYKPTKFSWEVLTPTNIQKYFKEFCAPEVFAIAVDIETFKDPLSIRCIGYTALALRATGIESISVILPLTSPERPEGQGEWAVAWMRKFNWETRAAKITQNGKYDNAYLLRYNAPLYNWCWDTAHLFHAWLSELPKDLAFLNAFCIRDAMYWKDLARTNDLYEYYRYNCLDHWTTANVFLAIMQEAPRPALHNYLLEFPLVFPCLLAEMTGIKRDMEALEKARTEQERKQEALQTSLNKMICPQGNEGINVLSNPQMKQLMGVLGCADIAEISCDEKHIEKARFRHPLNARILQVVLDIREARKLLSTYLTPGKEMPGSPVVLYALNPHGTDTARLASREHHFWCGLQIQNIVRGPSVKQTFVAREGFLFGKCDLEQAESRDTANISGDIKLIEAVSGPKDFHSINASAFFGLSYESIYDDTTKKTKNKMIRDLAKRVNHGANYNMGAAVLVDTMGLTKIFEARRLLGLPGSWGALQIAEYLLSCFHAAYPSLKTVYYPAIVSEVMLTGHIVSRAYHHTPYNEKMNPDVEGYIERGDWTRRCFGNPSKNKLDLNALVAHPPQSLNARTLNEAFLRVFHEVALPHATDFHLLAQIHDEIFFEYREGHEHLAYRVKEIMEIPVTVRGVDNHFRQFTVPAAIKLGAKYWNELE